MQQQTVDDLAEKSKLASDSSFNALINAQSIEGYWPAEQKDAILKFLDDSQKKVVNEFLTFAAQTAEAQLAQRLILTILANDIFTKRFQHKREEWRMIGRNMTRWINSARTTLTKAAIKDMDTKMAGTETAIKAMDYTVKV